MNTPPLLLASAVLLWGMQTGWWVAAAPVAVALEAPRALAVRWDLSREQLNHITDFCSILLAAAALYLYFAFGNPRAILLTFQWLPVVVLPLAIAQAYSARERIDVTTLVWALRRHPPRIRTTIDVSYPYLAMWILAASAVEERSAWFYPSAALLAAWALAAVRLRRFPVVSWMLLVAAAAGIGYGIQLGLYRTQAWLVDVVPEWLVASGSRTDPYRSRTDLGYIGELKQDDAIVLRVRTDQPLSRPLLLHRATYNHYFGTTWSARNAPLVPRPPDARRSVWKLGETAVPAKRVTVFDYSPRGDPVLSLPGGTFEVRGLNAITIKRNALGTVQAEHPPGYLTYIALAGAATGLEGPPDEEDLGVPKPEQALFGRLAGELGLARLAPAEVAAAVQRYFAQGFYYSAYRAPSLFSRSPLADFLLETKAGHCEFFATATTLLLRAGGVPARYATGFSVQEYSRLEEAYVVRVRHAHAWVKAYVDGRWREIDTTPPVWITAEREAAPLWSPLADLWSWLRFQLAQLAAREDGAGRSIALVAIVVLIAGVWLAWRLAGARRARAGTGDASRPATAGYPGAGRDSEFFRIEQYLGRAGFPRAAHETVGAWVARIGAGLPRDTDRAALEELARLHYRYRFDPLGLGPDERRELSARAHAWLAQRARAG